MSCRSCIHGSQFPSCNPICLHDEVYSKTEPTFATLRLQRICIHVHASRWRWTTAVLWTIFVIRVRKVSQVMLQVLNFWHLLGVIQGRISL